VLFAAPRRRLLARLSAPPAVAYGLLAVLVVAGILEGRYVVRKFESAVKLGRGLEASAFVDRVTGGGQPTLTWLWGDPATINGRSYIMLLAQYANRDSSGRIEGDLGAHLEADGSLRDAEPPRYLVRFRDYAPYGYESEIVGQGLDGPPYAIVVERLADPRAAFRIDGPGPDGALPDGARATIALLPAAREPGRCVGIDVGVPPGAPATGFTARAGAKRLAGGRIEPGAARSLKLPTAGADAITITARGDGLRLGESRLVRC
jgi:hypothetical protein